MIVAKPNQIQILGRFGRIWGGHASLQEPMTISASDDLMQRAMAGDAAALDGLWAVHRRWVAAILLAHAPAGVEIEDLLQDVAMTVVRRVGELAAPGAFRGWLRTVAINAARSAHREREVRRRRAPMVEMPPDALQDPRTARGVHHDLLRDTLAQLAELPVDLREVLTLRAVEGQSQRAIAEALGVPETTVETRLARARRMLRRRTAESDGAACHGWRRQVQ